MKTFTILSCAAALGLTAGVMPAAADGELHLYNWSNYFPPALIEKYSKETGTKVSIDAYASEEDLLAKLQAGGGGYDVIFPGPTTLKAMIEKNLIADIKVNEMENYKNVAEPFRTVVGDEKRTYSAPYMWGTTGFTYIPSMVPGGKLEESWKEVFEPRDELKGKIGMLDEKSDVWNAAAYYLGIDKCTEDAAEAQKILDLLEKQKPAVKVYSNDGTIDRTAAGEVALHMQWNGASHRVKKTKPEAVFVYPKEGVTFWTDTMAVPASAPNMDNAKAFINWMLLPENAAEASNYTGYMNAIEGSGEHMSEALQKDPAVNTPPEYNDRLNGFKQCSPKALELRDKVWTKLKS
jgi:spermidine/putrescine transport system substrate-binding protein